MLPMMVLAHLLGDYPLQTDAIARWKARSVWGVLVHGLVVTLTHLVCAVALEPAWWPYALLIGGIHTGVDVGKARLLRTADATWSMVWFLADQTIHLLVIVGVVAWSGVPLTAEVRTLGGLHVRWEVVVFLVGYLTLLQPAWVFLRFVVRGIWGPEAAPPLGSAEDAEKIAPMLERVLIASLALAGQPALVLLVLLPRRLQLLQAQESGVLLWVRPTTHWAETFMGAALAIGVGLVLRIGVLGW